MTFQMVAGKFVSQAFDDESGDFSLTFSASLSLAQVNISSMIYLNDKLYYPKGYTVRYVGILKEIDKSSM